MSKHLTMQELEDLGFEITKSYPKDHYVTQRREKGLIEVDTSYEIPSGKFICQEICIIATCLSIKPKDLKKLDKILNKDII